MNLYTEAYKSKSQASQREAGPLTERHKSLTVRPGLLTERPVPLKERPETN